MGPVSLATAAKRTPIEVDGPPADRSAATHQSNPPPADEASRHPSTFAGKQDLSREINLFQQRISEALVAQLESTGPTPETSALNTLYTHKVNLIQSEIRAARERVNILQDAGNPTWLALEGSCNLAEKHLIETLAGVDESNLNSQSLAVSRELDSVFSNLTTASNQSKPQTATTPTPPNIEAINSVLKELGLPPLQSLETEAPGDLATAPVATQRDAIATTRLLLGQQRELYGDSLSALQEQIATKREQLGRQIEILNEQAAEHSYGLFDVFTSKYQLENTADEMQVAAITKTTAELNQLEQEAGGISQQSSVLTAALSVLEAEEARARGADVEANRYLVQLKVGATGELLSPAAAAELPKLHGAVSLALTELESAGALSERERLLYSNADRWDRLEAAVEHRRAFGGEVAVAADVVDQVRKRQTFVVASDRAGSEVFKEAPLWKGQRQNEVREQRLLRLEFQGADHDGEAYEVLFTREAHAAWGKIPADAQPVVLSPLRHLTRTTTSSGRNGSRTEVSDPGRSTVQAEHVAYTRAGKLFALDGRELDLASLPNRAWVERQVEQARSFSTSTFRPTVPLRQYVPGAGTAVPVGGQLYSLRTQSGDRIDGIRMSAEVRQVLAERPPEGMTLVIRRIPESLQLSGVQREYVGQGRGTQERKYQSLMRPIDELRMEDLAYAEVKDGKAVLQPIVQSRASTQGAGRVELRSSAPRTAREVFAGVPTYQGRPQKHLLEMVHRRVVFRGGEQEGREYSLLLTKEAEAAWQGMPAGSKPVLLRPVSSMELKIQSSGGRTPTRSSTIANQPYEFLLQRQDVGYELGGRVFQADGTEVALVGHPHASWVRGQLEHGRAVTVVALRYPDTLLGMPENGQAASPLNTPLYRITTNQGQRIEGVRVSPEVRELLARELPVGSSVVLKRIPEPVALSPRFERDGQGFRQVLREPDELTLNDVALAEGSASGFVVRDVFDPRDVSQERSSFAVAEVTHAQELANRDIPRMLASDEDVQFLQSAALSTHNTLSHLQQSLTAHQDGSSREAFVEFVRNEARPLHEFLNSPETAQRITALEVRLAQLKAVRTGVADSETEAQINQQIQAIEKFVAVVKDPRTRHVVETLMDESKFSADNWANFSRNELPVIAGAVGGAVVASAAVVLTAGWAGVVVVPLWVTAAGGAIGGVIGSELTKEGMYRYENAYGNAADGSVLYGNRSLLGTKLSDTAVFNAETGQYEQLSWGDVSGTYAFDAGRNFVFSYATMLGSQAMAGQLTQLFQRTQVLERIAQNSDGMKFVLRKLAEANSKTLSQVEQASLRASFREAFKKTPLEFVDEMSDEALEDLGTRFADALAEQLTGGSRDFGQGNIAALLLGTLKGTRVSGSTFAYDARVVETLGVEALGAATNGLGGLETALNQARSNGFLVQDLGRGYYSVLDPQRGQKFTLRPMTELDQGALTLPQLAVGLNGALGDSTTQLAPSTPAEAFNQQYLEYMHALSDHRRAHPETWRDSVKEALGPQAGVLLARAQEALAAQGVTAREVRDADGVLQALEIVPVLNQSEFNTYAARLQKAKGVQLVYDPLLIAEHQAGALYRRTDKRVFLSHDSIAVSRPTEQIYHEKIHAVFDRIRIEGGDSLYFGHAELSSGALSLDEFATYSELLARAANRLATAADPGSAEFRSEVARLERHLGVFQSFSAELAGMLQGDVSALQPQFRTEQRIDADGNAHVHLVGVAEINGRVIELDLAQAPEIAGEVPRLPSSEQAQARFSEKIKLLQETATHSMQQVAAIQGLLKQDQLAGAEGRQQVQRLAQALRGQIADHYLLRADPESAANVQLDSLILPFRVPGAGTQDRGSGQISVAATHEGDSAVADRAETAPIGVQSQARGEARTERDALNSMLEQVIAASQQQRESQAPNRAPEPSALSRTFGSGVDAFVATLHPDRVVLELSSGERVEARAKLSDAARGQLLRGLEQRAILFGPKVSGMDDALRGLIRQANVQAAFYGQDLSPLAAAQALQSMLKQEGFPATRIQITEGSTAVERLEALRNFANTATKLAQTLEPRLKGEKINEAVAAQLQQALEQQRGSALLEQLLGPDVDPESVKVEHLLEALAEQEQQRVAPVYLRLQSNYLFDREGKVTELVFAIERRPNGSLAIEQLLSSNQRGTRELVSLQELVERIQQSTRVSDQARPVWRSYTQYSSQAFSSSQALSATRQYSATHEVEPTADGVPERVQFSPQFAEPSLAELNAVIPRLEQVRGATKRLQDQLTELSRLPPPEGLFGPLVAKYRSIKQDVLQFQLKRLVAQEIELRSTPFAEAKYRQVLREQIALGAESPMGIAYLSQGWSLNSERFSEVLRQELHACLTDADPGRLDAILQAIERINFSENEQSPHPIDVVFETLRSPEFVAKSELLAERLSERGADGIDDLLQLRKTMDRAFELPMFSNEGSEIDASYWFHRDRVHPKIMSAALRLAEQGETTRALELKNQMIRFEPGFDREFSQACQRGLSAAVARGDIDQAASMLSNHSLRLGAQPRAELAELAARAVSIGKFAEAQVLAQAAMVKLELQHNAEIQPLVASQLVAALIAKDFGTAYGLINSAAPETLQETAVQQAAFSYCIDSLRTGGTADAVYVARAFKLDSQLLDCNEVRSLALAALPSTDSLLTVDPAHYAETFGFRAGSEQTRELVNRFAAIVVHGGVPAASFHALGAKLGVSNEVLEAALRTATANRYAALVAADYQQGAEEFRARHQLGDAELQTALLGYIKLRQELGQKVPELVRQHPLLSAEALGAEAKLVLMHAVMLERIDSGYGTLQGIREDSPRAQELAALFAKQPLPIQFQELFARRPALYLQVLELFPEQRANLRQIAWADAFDRIQGYQARVGNQQHNPWRQQLVPLLQSVSLDPSSSADGALLADFVGRYGMHNTPTLFEVHRALATAKVPGDLDPVVQSDLRMGLGIEATRFRTIADLQQAIRAKITSYEEALLIDTPATYQQLASELHHPLAREIFQITLGSGEWSRQEDPLVIVQQLAGTRATNPERFELPAAHRERSFSVPGVVRRSLSEGAETSLLEQVRQVTENKEVQQRLAQLQVAALRPDRDKPVDVFWKNVQQQALDGLQSKLASAEAALVGLDPNSGKARALEQQRAQTAKLIAGIEAISLTQGSFATSLQQIHALGADLKPVRELLQVVSMRHMQEVAPEGQWELLVDALQSPTSADSIEQTVRFLRDFAAEHYFKEQLGSFGPKLERLWGLDALDSHPLIAAHQRITQLNEGTLERKGSVEVTLVPSRGMGLVYSGDLADACYTGRHGEFAQGSYQGITAYSIVLDRGKPTQRVGGSFLLIETSTPSGEPVLLVRGNNPKQNFLSRVDTAAYLGEVLGQCRAIADEQGIEHLAVVLDPVSGASSNRAEVSAYYAEHFADAVRIPLRVSRETVFNGYPVFDEAGRHPAVVLPREFHGERSAATVAPEPSERSSQPATTEQAVASGQPADARRQVDRVDEASKQVALDTTPNQLVENVTREGLFNGSFTFTSPRSGKSTTRFSDLPKGVANLEQHTIALRQLLAPGQAGAEQSAMVTDQLARALAGLSDSFTELRLVSSDLQVTATSLCRNVSEGPVTAEVRTEGGSSVVYGAFPRQRFQEPQVIQLGSEERVRELFAERQLQGEISFDAFVQELALKKLDELRHVAFHTDYLVTEIAAWVIEYRRLEARGATAAEKRAKLESIVATSSLLSSYVSEFSTHTLDSQANTAPAELTPVRTVAIPSAPDARLVASILVSGLQTPYWLNRSSVEVNPGADASNGIDCKDVCITSQFIDPTSDVATIEEQVARLLNNDLPRSPLGVICERPGEEPIDHNQLKNLGPQETERRLSRAVMFLMKSDESSRDAVEANPRFRGWDGVISPMFTRVPPELISKVFIPEAVAASIVQDLPPELRDKVEIVRGTRTVRKLGDPELVAEGEPGITLPDYHGAIRDAILRDIEGQTVPSGYFLHAARLSDAAPSQTIPTGVGPSQPTQSPVTNGPASKPGQDISATHEADWESLTLPPAPNRRAPEAGQAQSASLLHRNELEARGRGLLAKWDVDPEELNDQQKLELYFIANNLAQVGSGEELAAMRRNSEAFARVQQLSIESLALSRNDRAALAELARQQRQWAESKFTDPQDHNPEQFRYVVTMAASTVENAITRAGNLAQQKPLICASVVSEAHPWVYSQAVGFVLEVPQECVFAASNRDFYSRPDEGYGDRAAAVSYLLSEHERLAADSGNQDGLPPPGQIIRETAEGEHNEVLIASVSPITGREVRVKALVVQERDGEVQGMSAEEFAELTEFAAANGLPIVRLPWRENAEVQEVPDWQRFLDENPDDDADY